MPLDPATGVHYEVQGQGRPLLIGLPLMASCHDIFGAGFDATLHGYLDGLTERYRVLRVDYPSIGGSRSMPPEALTPDRVCADLLGVATAAGFDRFTYWGYSWGGAVGLQLATRSDRLDALVVGGWPPLGAPYADLLEATCRKQADPDPSSMKVLRSKDQYRQWETWNRSLLTWPEAEQVARIGCPKMVFFGEEGDLVEAGIPVRIASLIRAHRDTLQAQGWRVLEVAGQGHGVCMQPERFVPHVRAFLDEVLP